jgi:hypothetical protein
MTRFQDGQKVIVHVHAAHTGLACWREAKFLFKTKSPHEDRAAYLVRFQDGKRALIEEDYIRERRV